MLQPLFPMYLIKEDIGTPQLNAGLLDAASLVKEHSRHSNFWDIDHPSVYELQQHFNRLANALAQQCFPDAKDSYTTARGWINSLQHGQWTSPHSHPGSKFAGVYYVQAPEGSGNLLIQDPSAGSEWCNYVDGPRDCRVYQKVQAVTGRLIVFPAHLVHCTEPNLLHTPRICVATNFEPA
jgi:uncharacterized protein (TIGR02466 family)